MRSGFIVSLAALLGVTSSGVAEEAITVEELDRLMDETLVYEYANCNALSVPTVVMVQGVTMHLSDRKTTDRDLAVEAAMDCHKEWLALVVQLSSARGYGEALRIGLEIQDKMIGQNVAHVRSVPKS